MKLASFKEVDDLRNDDPVEHHEGVCGMPVPGGHPRHPKLRGSSIIAIGTSVVRALEAAAHPRRVSGRNFDRRSRPLGG